MRTLTLLLPFVAFVAACDPQPLAPTIQVGVAALNLPEVSNASYRLTVLNDVGELVWTADVDAQTYGDGAGAITYIGPCDAQDNDGDGSALNQVQLVILELPPLGPSDWVNPTANGPLVRVAECRENADTLVEFNVTILRSAEQGFFDVAVNFDDIYCSAKLDCVDESGAPISLVSNAVGERDTTAVLAMACSAGVGADTHLYMDDIEIACASGESYFLDPSREGMSQGQGPLSFATLVMRGSEALMDNSKAYWNVAMGLDFDQLASPNGGHTGCVIKTRATATDGPLSANGSVPGGTSYPYIDVNVPLSGTSGLACTQHPLNGGNGVSVSYQPQVSLAHGYNP